MTALCELGRLTYLAPVVGSCPDVGSPVDGNRVAVIHLALTEVLLIAAGATEHGLKAIQELRMCIEVEWTKASGRVFRDEEFRRDVGKSVEDVSWF